MVWEFCVYFVYMIPLETDVLRKHRFQKPITFFDLWYDYIYAQAHTSHRCSTRLSQPEYSIGSLSARHAWRFADGPIGARYMLRYYILHVKASCSIFSVVSCTFRVQESIHFI